jgi:hypothetical protein
MHGDRNNCAYRLLAIGKLSEPRTLPAGNSGQKRRSFWIELVFSGAFLDAYSSALSTFHASTFQRFVSPAFGAVGVSASFGVRHLAFNRVAFDFLKRWQH